MKLAGVGASFGLEARVVGLAGITVGIPSLDDAANNGAVDVAERESRFNISLSKETWMICIESRFMFQWITGRIEVGVWELSDHMTRNFS